MLLSILAVNWEELRGHDGSTVLCKRQRLELSSDSLTKPYHAFETLEMVYGAQGPYKRALHGFTAGRTWSSRSTRLDTGIQNHCSMPESQWGPQISGEDVQDWTWQGRTERRPRSTNALKQSQGQGINPAAYNSNPYLRNSHAGHSPWVDRVKGLT